MRKIDLSYSGVQFTRDGKPVVMAGFDAYRLLDRHRLRENIIPVLDSNTDLLSEASGQVPWLVPVARIFTMAYKDEKGGFMLLRPGDYDYSSVSAIADFLWDEWGIVGLWNAIADRRLLGLSDNDCQNHVGALVHALTGHGVSLLELVNEANHKGTEVDPGMFNKPNGLLSSRGSMNAGDHPFRPGWDFNVLHAERGSVRGSLSAGTAAYAVNGFHEGDQGDPGDKEHPVLVEEMEGAANDPRPGSRRSNPDFFSRNGYLSAAFAAGGFFHSDSGIDAAPFDRNGVEWACGKAFFMGMSKADPAQIYRGEP